MGRQVGLVVDVHDDVEILPPDNGERFFSEYLVQQLLRMKMFVPDPKTGRCMCNRCGGRKHINNKYSDTISINRVVVRNEEAKAAQQKEEEEAKAAQQKVEDEAKAAQQKEDEVKKAAQQKEEEKRNDENKRNEDQKAAKQIEELPPPMMKQPPSYSLPQLGSIPPPVIMIPTNTNNKCNCCCPKSPFQFGFCCSVYQHHSYSTTRKFGRPPHCRICNQKKNKNTYTKAKKSK